MEDSFPRTVACDVAHIGGHVDGLEFFMVEKGVAMASAEKTRILVYSLFILAVIALGIFYRPVGAVSQSSAESTAVLQK